MTTDEIKGFFSPEHRLLVFLICICFWGLYRNDNLMQTILLQNAEIKADIKIIAFKVNHGKETKTESKKLAAAYFHGCKRKSKFQTPGALLAVIRRNPMYCTESKH